MIKDNEYPQDPQYWIGADQMVLTVKGKTIAPSKWRYTPPNPPLARTDDPATSKAAAEKCEQFRAKHEALIYDALHFFGDKGGTAKEIASKIQMTDVQVNRRLSHMASRGLIVRCHIPNGNGVVSRGGCAVWWVTK